MGGLANGTSKRNLIRFANGLCSVDGELVRKDVWVDRDSGKIVDGQLAFFDEATSATETVDLEGLVLSPGFIEVQINGAMGFDFSVAPEARSPDSYTQGITKVSEYLLETGVTSYLPTITSQSSELYKAVLPIFARYSHTKGAEILGVHTEGPFIAKEKRGIHSTEHLLKAQAGFADLEECYGAESLRQGGPVKMITAAPELINHTQAIEEMCRRGIRYSIGHSTATFEDAKAGVTKGANMITHLFNAMLPMHHRNPGILGLLGDASLGKTVYYGIIADNFHVHPSCVNMAYHTNSKGTILVSDAMAMLGLPVGIYDWTNGEKIVKDEKNNLVLQSTGSIAGSSVTLDECLRNFFTWTGANLAKCIACVTEHPARMLGCYPQKGSLEHGSDADLVVLTPSGHIRSVYKKATRVL